MHIHEYQGKEVLRRFGIPVPRGYACFSPDEAADAAARLGGRCWLVKPQRHAGGPGLRRAWSTAEVRHHAAELLAAPAAGSAGGTVRRLLVEESLEVEKCFHLGLAVDRAARRVALTASAAPSARSASSASDVPAAGAAARTRRLLIDPATGVKAAEADGIARDIGIPGKLLPQVRTLLQNLYQAFDGCDAAQAEIDPLALTRDGRVVALGVRFGFDPNGLFRQREIAAMRDADEDDAAGGAAAVPGLARQRLGGEIGCLVNGSGLALATLDALRLHGGRPADVFDLGGGATAEKVAAAFGLMLRDAPPRAVLVNVFGGLAKCDGVARGLIAAARQAGSALPPLVVRMKGTNETLARTLLGQSGLAIIHADEIDEAAGFAVASALSTPQPPARKRERA